MLRLSCFADFAHPTATVNFELSAILAAYVPKITAADALLSHLKSFNYFCPYSLITLLLMVELSRDLCHFEVLYR